MSNSFIFELHLWKYKNKQFSLQILMNSYDYCGWHDYYTIILYCNNKKKNSYTGRRFTIYYNKDYISFKHVLGNHKDVIEKWIDFHHHKIDILSLKVLNVIQL